MMTSKAMAALLALTSSTACVQLADPALAAGTELNGLESRQVATNEWSRKALIDLSAIRSLLQENHPGPVDALNPSYRKWLDDGYRLAVAYARTVKTLADYDRAISYYVNGFRDLHINWWMNEPQPKVWPGFLVAEMDDRRIEVSAASPAFPILVGSKLTSCDGTAAPHLLQNQLYRYKVNPDIPHLAAWWTPEFLVRYADDTQRPKSCRFETRRGRKTLKLAWTVISDEEAAKHLKAARPFPSGELGIHQSKNIFLISIPTFQYGGEGVTKIQAFLASLREKRDQLLQADAVIIDVRGNTGGNSSWGQQAAKILWDPSRVEPIVDSFDWTSEYRTSPKIEARWRAYGDSMKKAGEREQSERNYKIAEGIQQARAAGKDLWLNPSPAKTSKVDYSITSPFQNQVYFLTDERCASACLDFADILIRIPGVTHIGRKTLADAIYIDNLAEQLPSGVSTFTWSAKVYRNRVRGNNEWYTPMHILKRDQMTTEAVLEWVRSRLNKSF
jgi:hypothetical protein